MDADPPATVDLTDLPFTTDEGVAARAAIGLITLSIDQTLEYEWRSIFRLPGVAVYQARLWCDPAINPETLRAMEGRIAEATRLILPGMRLDAIAFACTSGAMVIGDEGVAARVHEARPGIPVTSPMAAGIAACRALGARRVGLLTPYVPRINTAMRAAFEAGGVPIMALGGFNEEDDRIVARITTGSVIDGARRLAEAAPLDALFVSCTSLRVVEIVEELEAELGVPVSSSNHALAWHCLRLAGVPDPVPGLGRLFGV